MKNLIAIVFFMIANCNASVFLDGENGEKAWAQLRELHAIYLMHENNTTHHETERWIAEEMLKWLESKKKEYTQEIDNQKKRVTTLENQSKSTYQDLRTENSQLKNELDDCKMWNIIAYSIIAMIAMLFSAFILIKKCQSKKVPEKIIEEVTKSA